MTERFSGKVAIVTGGASGIGRASALAFAAEGASVAIADVDRAGGEDALREAIATGGQAIFVEADVSKEAGAATIVDQTVASFGGVDILHNNAGVVSYGTVPDTPEEEWDRVLGINLKGVYLCSKHAVPELAKRGGGAIVNTASVQAFASQRLVAAYASSKAGVVALTKTMALDHAREGIRVNCVCPGSIDTPMVRHAATRFSMNDPEAAIRGWAEAHPAGRIGEPGEVAAAVLFLASSDASFVTGATLTVDGGLLAQLM